MERKNQTQKQSGGSNHNSQNQNTPLSKPKSQAPVKHTKDEVVMDQSSDEEDSETDERLSSEVRFGKAHTDDEHPMTKPKSNVGWQTGDSGIPENASDNPKS